MVENKPALDEAMRRLTRALGTPKHLKLPWQAVVLGLGSLVGNLERLTLRERASSMDLVEDGYQCVPQFQARPQDLITPPINVELVARHVQEQMAVMTSVRVGSHIWLSAMAHVLGQLAAHHGLPREAVKQIIGEAWDKTTEADVERFQRLKKARAEA